MSVQCHVVFFGETGVGKSSIINLLKAGSTQASNGPNPPIQGDVGHQAVLNGKEYTLWDTHALDKAPSGFLWNFFRFEKGPEKELKKFLKERYQRHEIDLLVYCVHGSRATDVLAKYYNKFCRITRQLVAPVVIVITHLEDQPDMESWWSRNSSHLEQLKMAFDGHACITTIPGHAQMAGSKERLVDLITKKPSWNAQRIGSYFGSRLQTVITPAVPPGDEPLPPRRASAEAANVTQKVTDAPHVDEPLQLSIEETFRPGPSCIGPHSVSTSYIGVPLQSCEDYLEDKLPSEHSTATIVRRRGYATLSGTFGDVWECNLIEGEKSCIVAVKALKLPRNINQELWAPEKKLRRELRVWARLRHQNIVPLLGIVSDFGPLPSMVSPWFRNGSLSSYLKNPLMPTREKRQLVKDIAAGLSYLHSNEIIHGDLHSDNVLISDAGGACLTDFGLSYVPEFVGRSYLKSSICGALQFADPALVQHVQNSQNLQDVFLPTQPCDVYSFGGLMLHVLSQKKPYDGLTTGNILRKVLTGERPEIPKHDSITLLDKALIRKCWDHEEHNRPLTDDLVAALKQQFL